MMHIPDHVALAALRLLQQHSKFSGHEAVVHLRDVIENQDRAVMARDMRLGDVVELDGGGGFRTMVVEVIDDELVTLFRPYVHLGDIQTAHVLCYMGSERLTLYLNSTVGYQLIRRVL